MVAAKIQARSQPHPWPSQPWLPGSNRPSGGLPALAAFSAAAMEGLALAGAWDLESAGVLTAVVPGQDCTGPAGPTGHGALAELAADQRKAGYGHREPAGLRGAHRTRSCQTSAHTSHLRLATLRDMRQKRSCCARFPAADPEMLPIRLLGPKFD